jgi:hypothetical protein
MELFSEIVNESELLTELKKSREKDVIYAINNMLHVRIGYNDEQGGKGKRERFIYPVAYGLTKRGNPAIRAFQTAGSTKRGVPKWKLFLFDRIFSWSNGKRSFKVYSDSLKELGFNDSGDLGMTKIFAIAPIAREDVMVASPSSNDISQPFNKTDISQTDDVQNKVKNTSNDYMKASQQRKSDVDNTSRNVYINNDANDLAIDSPKTEPITKKQNMLPKQKAQNKTNLYSPDTKPVEKNDIMPVQNDYSTDTTQQTGQENEFQTKVHNLMDRMNNLYKNTEDDGNI